MNRVLLISGFSWAAAQVIKVIVELICNRALNIRRIMSSGGMPSSHSATVCACACAAGLECGFGSAIFGVTCVMAFIVMYDAANVRRETGQQSKILNYMMENWTMENWTEKPDLFARQLKELIGHTPLQVFVGALLGVAIAVLGHFLFQMR